MDIATELDVDVSHFGGDCRLYQLDKPFEGADHIVVCDRTPLAGEVALLLAGLPPEVNADVAYRTIDIAIEVFAVNETGTYESETLVALRRLISLRRYSEGVDFGEVLGRLGYTITDPPPAPEPEEP